MRNNKITLCILCIVSSVLLVIPLSSVALFDPYGPLIYARQLAQLQKMASNIQQIIQLRNEFKYELEQTEQLMQGHYGYGNDDFNFDLQSWGSAAGSWSSLANLYQDGASQSELAQAARTLEAQYPIETGQQFSPSDPDSAQAQYYQWSAKTALASRATSQVAFNRIQQELSVIHQLQQQVEQAKNTKAAMDLNNRLQIENTLVNVQLERLNAIRLQQASVLAQSQVNQQAASAQFYQWSNQ